MASDNKMRLQRFLAQAGVASRRRSEELIQAGKVKVNNKVVKELGTRVDPRRDKVHFGGRRVLPEEHVWILLNKPDGTVSTVSDPEGRQTVMDVIGPQHVRLYPVGRLDYHTQGALLLTNDGELANALSHPSGKIPRVYHVKLRGDVNPDDLAPLRKGVTLDTGETVKAQVAILGTTGLHTWIEMILTQGLNHQVHRMVECIGGTVLKLVRVAYGPLTVEELSPGKHRLLGQTEIDKLRAAVNLSGQTRRDQGQPGRRTQGHRARPAGQRKTGRGTTRPQKPAGAGAGKPRKAQGAGMPRKAQGAVKPRKAQGAVKPRKVKETAKPRQAEGADKPRKARKAKGASKSWWSKPVGKPKKAKRGGKSRKGLGAGKVRSAQGTGKPRKRKS